MRSSIRISHFPALYSIHFYLMFRYYIENAFQCKHNNSWTRVSVLMHNSPVNERQIEGARDTIQKIRISSTYQQHLQVNIL